MNVVEVKGLCKSLGKKEILKNVSFTIGEHEIVGFIGPNGSGKSTTTKCLTSLLRPDKGSIVICGHDLLKEREEALRYTSALIENPGLFPTLSGFENLIYFAKLRGVDNARVEEIIAFTKLGKHIHKRSAHYSLGMKQRLGLGIALLAKPKFLILDEPTNGLDPSGIMELREELRELVNKEGMSILVSSHQLGEMDKIADRLICINNGVIIEPPQHIQEQHAYTFLFHGEDQMRAKQCAKGLRVEEKNKGLCVYFHNEEEMQVYLGKLLKEQIIIRDIVKEVIDIEQLYREMYQEEG